MVLISVGTSVFYEGFIGKWTPSHTHTNIIGFSYLDLLNTKIVSAVQNKENTFTQLHQILFQNRFSFQQMTSDSCAQWPGNHLGWSPAGMYIISRVSVRVTGAGEYIEPFCTCLSRLWRDWPAVDTSHRRNVDHGTTFHYYRPGALNQ